MYCVTQAERALVCARQTVGQHCNVRERAKANKNQSSASREIESNPVRLVDLNTKKSAHDAPNMNTSTQMMTNGKVFTVHRCRLSCVFDMFVCACVVQGWNP